MTHAERVSPPLQSALTAHVAGVLVSFKARRARKKLFRQTVREMSGLTASELADLGLARSEIRRIAWQAAYEL